jgi:guanylate kinase
VWCAQTLTAPKKKKKKRIEGRGDTSPASMRKRLAIAQIELEHARIPGFFDRVVVSGDREETYRTFKQAILDSQDPNPKM